MVHCSRRRSLGTLLALTLLIALTALLVVVGQARADEPSPSPSPTVVRELAAERTEYSTTYQLSDGTYRVVYSQTPVHYRDAAGDWVAIDPTFVLAPEGGVTTAAAPVEVTIRDETSDQAPVTVALGSAAISVNLVGALEDDGVAVGDATVYTSVATETTQTYVATGNGLEQILTLLGPAAPGRFTYRIDHMGLVMSQMANGEWALFAPGATEPTFVLGCLTVFDASLNDVEEPAYCDGARQTVTAGADSSTVTITVPREWLADPARVWPVTIDPSVYSRSNPVDTYINTGTPNTAHGSVEPILCGKVGGSSDNSRALVRFNDLTTSVPASSHVTSAQFSIRQCWEAANPNDLVHVYRVGTDSTNWGNSATWNNTTLTGSEELCPNTLYGGDSTWVNVDCTGTAQGWVRGDYNNYGFCVRQLDADTINYAKKFRSAEYSNATYRPNLTVNYETPSASTSYTTSDGSGQCYIGNTVNVTATAAVSDASQITAIEVGSNTAAHSPQAPIKAIMVWYKGTPPAPPSGSSWTSTVALADGSHAAVSSGSCITSFSCTHAAGSNSATFSFTVADSWDSYTNNYWDSRLFMSSGTNTWTSPSWFAGTTVMNVRPKAIPTSVTATGVSLSSGSWFVGSGPNDSDAAGRARLDLSWEAAYGATDYRIYLYDGVSIQEVGTAGAGVTTWSSLGKHLFPSDSTIRSWPYDWQGNPFAAGTLELRDNPNELYNKLNPQGSISMYSTHYWGYVVPFNDAGSAKALSGWSDFMAQMDGRSVMTQEEQHTTADLGSWDGHALAARLDQGS